MKKQTVLYGTMILSAANLAVRIVGFAYRIILSRYLGAEGMGIYQLVFPTCMVLVTLVTSGLPLAVSRLSSQKLAKGDTKGAQAILQTAQRVVITLSVVLSLLLFFGADFIAKIIIKEPRTTMALQVFSPCILILGLSNLYTSYYHGQGNVWPSAISELIEQAIRVVLTIAVFMLIPADASPLAIAMVVACMCAGELGGYTYLKILHMIESKKNPCTPLPMTKNELSPIFSIAVPITGMRLISSVISSLTALLIPQRLLLAGLTQSQALAQLGIITGMAFPLLYLPGTLTGALAVMMMPRISALQAQDCYEEISRKAQKALRYAAVAAFPSAILLFCCAQSVCNALFQDVRVGQMLMLLAPLCIPISFQQVFSSMLNGLGLQKTALWNYLYGAAASLFCIYFLIPIPTIGIYGYIIGIYCGTLTTCFFHGWTFLKHLNYPFSLSKLLSKPALALLFMCFGISLFMPLTERFLGAWGSIAATLLGFLVYFSLLLVWDYIALPSMKLLKNK